MKPKHSLALASSITCVAALLTPVLLPARDRAAPARDVYYYLVFSNPLAGKEDEYNKWYNTEHAPDVVAVPGFVTAQRMVAATTQLRETKPPTKYLIVYKIVTDDLAAVNAEVVRRLQTGQTVMSPTFDGTAPSPTGIFKTIGPVVEHRGASTSSGSAFYQFVFVNPVPGLEREFNTWYETQHLPDMVSTPGFVDGQRLKLASREAGGTQPPYQYLVMYKIVTDDLPLVFDTFRRRAATMVTSRAFGDSAGYTYKTFGPLIVGDEVRAKRQRSRTEAGSVGQTHSR